MSVLKYRPGRRKFIQTAAASALGVFAVPYYARRALGADDKLLVVNTWGGAFTDLERKHIFTPFTAQTGIKVEIDTPVSFAKLKAQVTTKNYLYDVSSLNAATLSQARNEGLVEPIDWGAVDRKATKNTFFGDFGVGFSVLSTALVYRKDKLPSGGPTSWADFFDTAKFPGPRSMGKRAYTTLAFAMLGAGAAKDKIYPIDIDRALKALDRIRPTVKTWWEHGNESEELLRRGEVHMMSIWNQRPVRLIKSGMPVEIVWNGAEHVPGYYYMAKGAPHKAAAMKFFNFVSRPEVQAAFAAETYYAPTNPDSIGLLSPDEQKFMSTKPEYLKVGFEPDADWLGQNIANIERRFIAWLAQR
jgi:putative spermidine/putrescine transport system substrate-binding protein